MFKQNRGRLKVAVKKFSPAHKWVLSFMLDLRSTTWNAWVFWDAANDSQCLLGPQELWFQSLFRYGFVISSLFSAMSYFHLMLSSSCPSAPCHILKIFLPKHIQLLLREKSSSCLFSKVPDPISLKQIKQMWLIAWGLQDKRIWEMGGCICPKGKINRRDVKRTTQELW